MNFNIIIVTGSAGFIGTHLCEQLLKNGETVYGLDNYITGSSQNTNYLLRTYKKFVFFECNIINKKELDFLENRDIKEIYHLASLASPDKYQSNPIETMQVNINGTYNMLEIAKNKRSKFLFTSTSEVYGDPLIHPQPESYYGNVNTVGPRSCYDESKRAGETYVNIFREKYQNDNLKIVRIFNTYGPRMNIDDGRVITNFIKFILNNDPIKINGSGLQTRSFCYISDMVTGLIKMMNSNEHGPINLGNPYCEFNLLELKECFEKILDKQLVIEHTPKLKDDPQVRRPDITLAKEKLNFEPVINLETGLLETYLYFAEKNIKK
jgi:nucleoside-diphosphate-sugar epimerase